MENQMETTEEVQSFHFYASNAGTWRVDNNVEELIKEMRTDKLGFMLNYVPLPITSNYDIKFFTPQVEGVVYLGFYEK
jgi:hypothetical protein